MPEQPYCADCQATIDINLNSLPVIAKCKCVTWTEGQPLPDWWCMTAKQARAMGATL